MRKILLSVMFLWAFLSQGQNMRFGVQAGATYSGFSGVEAPLVEYRYGLGFLGGLNVEYRFSERLSIKANLAYDRKSYRGKSVYELYESYDTPSVLYNQKLTHQYDYLSLPLLVQYGFAGNGSFYAAGGPFVAFLLDAKIKSQSTSVDGTIDGYDQPLDLTGLTKKLDYGVSLGLGKRFAVGSKSEMAVELRDNFGLADINDAAGGKAIKTNSLNLIVAWSIGL